MFGEQPAYSCGSQAFGAGGEGLQAYREKSGTKFKQLTRRAHTRPLSSEEWGEVEQQEVSNFVRWCGCRNGRIVSDRMHSVSDLRVQPVALLCESLVGLSALSDALEI